MFRFSYRFESSNLEQRLDQIEDAGVSWAIDALYWAFHVVQRSSTSERDKARLSGGP